MTADQEGVRLNDLINAIHKKVPEAGLEPARSCEHRILSPERLPIPPLGQRHQPADQDSAAIQLQFVARWVDKGSGVNCRNGPWVASHI